jgi:hypothetical protein
VVGLVIALVVVVVLVLVLVVQTVVLRRRGYSVGGRTVARCRQGHLFTTLWIPGASLKAVRLGWARYQFCPVGRHWSLVVPVKDADLTDEQRAEAAAHRDTSIP